MGTKDGKIYSIDQQPKGDFYRYMLSLVLTLKDQGKKGSKEEVINVYLTPGEEDSHAFDNWNIIPKLSDKKAWKSVSQATLKNFQKNLEKMSNPKNNVQVALQVL